MSTLLKSLALWLGALTSPSSNSTDATIPCDIFLAPSKLNNGGWGVYAARDFQESEVVELAPMYLVFPEKAPHVKHSVLDDYHYGIYQQQKVNSCISMGAVMFYNHHQEPNVRWMTSLGRGLPSWEDPESGTLVGFVTHRAIQQGEELFSTYGFGDDGPKWFATRRIEMANPTTIEQSKIPFDELDEYRNQYCSKAFAGPSQSTYTGRFMPADKLYLFQTNRLPTVDASNAIAKTLIKKGERIEVAPALVMSKEAIAGTALAPLVFSWNDFHDQQRRDLQDLRKLGQLKLQYQSQETGWHRLDRFSTFDDVAIFPAAGNVAMIQRIGHENPKANCELYIKSSGSGEGSAGIVLEIVALQDVEQGETLRLNIPSTGTDQEKGELLKLLVTTGQLIPESLRLELNENAGNNVDGEL